MPYKAYFENAGESLLLVNSEGKIIKINPAAERMFGYGAVELQGQRVEILIPTRFHRAHVTHFKDYMEHPRSRPMGAGMELAARRKDGQEFPVEISLTHALADGTSYVVCQVTDISPRLAREREGRREQMLRNLGSMAAGMAHDLNNPLTIIISRAELLLSESTALSEEARKDLEVIHHHAQRASRISHDLLALARQRPKPFAPVNLNAVVEEALLLLGGDLLKSGIQVQMELAEPLPEVMGDAVALEQIVMNILINAREVLPAGGHIQIRTEAAADKPGYVRLAVGDDGPGIAPDVLSRVFDFMYTSKAGGSGLGLWLSRLIAQNHRGELKAISEPGQGAQFWLSIPAIENK